MLTLAGQKLRILHGSCTAKGDTSTPKRCRLPSVARLRSSVSYSPRLPPAWHSTRSRATHAVNSYDASLLGVAGILTGINVIAVGIWMSDNPAAARAICTRQSGVLGVVMASSAVTAVAAGAVDPLLCFGLLVLLLVGISLVMHGALGLGT